MRAFFTTIWTLLAIIGYFALWGIGQKIQHDPHLWPLTLILAIIVLGIPMTIIAALIQASRRG